MPKQPLVSIIIPTYNRAHLIGATLDSISAQTYTNWECIVVDDGSTDGTTKLMETYCAKYTRFQYHHCPAERLPGGNAARNYGLELSTGDYVIFFDSDDLFSKEALEFRVTYISKCLNHDFLVFQTSRFFDTLTSSDCIWNDLSKPNTEDLLDFLSLNPVWSIYGPIWKRGFLIQSNLRFDESLKSWQDLDFHIRALLLKPNYFKVTNSKIGVYQRFHKGESIRRKETYNVITNRIDFFFKLISILKANNVFTEEVQKLVFKLFYFTLSDSKLANESEIWSKLQKELEAIPKVDFNFWKQYSLHRKLKFKVYRKAIIAVTLVAKKIFFYNRFEVDNYSNRTWYKIKINKL
ncbi:glycosyltransferase family 2 protein [Formosa sp. PL04]|uniref:glycosyltransferase family 2 protein n=1 Tax=Formosa sp. PL04 TaxID=3081755 RepID=UPI002980AE5B|nr:glycosyltransferase family 2 protein [Formosa sp. PL04]MDW5290752.1 glycosyltransferase family 2 protein [Formosa sp. PL04]